MSVKGARKYLMVSRFGLPLATLYATGFAIGDVVYRSSGHLGLFYGPLGDLRRAVLSDRRYYVGASSERWAMLIPLALWLIVLAVECRHQLRHRRRKMRLLLVIGYALGAFSIAGPMLGLPRSVPPVASDVFLGALAASGLVLAVGAWPDWGARPRLAAPLVCIAGVAMALWAFRMEDRARLGQGWWNAARQEVASAAPCSRTRG